MYLKYISKGQLKKFVKAIDPSISHGTITHNDDGSIKVFCLNHQFDINDFEFNDAKTGKCYSKQFRKFMIELLDAQSREVGDKYINSLHDYLEKDTIYGAII